jgi:hypothetical protein
MCHCLEITSSVLNPYRDVWGWLSIWVSLGLVRHLLNISNQQCTWHRILSPLPFLLQYSAWTRQVLYHLRPHSLPFWLYLFFPYSLAQGHPQTTILLPIPSLWLEWQACAIMPGLLVEMGVLMENFCPSWSWTSILPIYASRVAGFTYANPEPFFNPPLIKQSTGNSISVTLLLQSHS